MSHLAFCAHSEYLVSENFKRDLQYALKACLLAKKVALMQLLDSHLYQPPGAVKPAPRIFVCYECHGRSGKSLLCSISRPSFFCSAKACRTAHAARAANPLLALDVETLEVYCEECKNVLVNQHLDTLKLTLLPDLIKSLNPNHPPGTPQFHQFATPPALVGGHVGIEFGLKGMFNAGNSCFINAVLQCLCHLHSVRTFFLSGRHMPEKCSYCKTDPTLNCALAPNAFHHMITNADDGISNMRGCLACELDGVIQEMYTPGSSLGPVMPHRFIHALWLQSKNLAGYLQHDAHEFFICCIDELSKACDAYSKNSSYQLGPLFSGSCLSSVTCNTCGAVSGNEELFRDISLDISGDCCDALSLDDCLRRFTRVETLDADVARVCPTCHGNLFSKELSFTRPPSLLCLHLKRFEHDASFGRFTKIDRHVTFPFLFDLAPHIEGASSSLPVIYTLKGVVTHIGSMEKGHYVSWFSESGSWYFADDDSVTETSLGQVLAAQAYILFYSSTALSPYKV